MISPTRKIFFSAAVRVMTLALFLVTIGAGAALAQVKASVVNGTANTVSVIDTASNSVVATIPVGRNPARVALPRLAPDLIAPLIAQITALVANGSLTANQGDVLINKLNQIAAKLGGNQTGAACNQFGAFINQVQAFINHGSLTQSQGQALIDTANAIMTSLGCS